MTESFVLVNLRHHPTREETLTVGRHVGEEFLLKYLGPGSIRFSGYIVQDMQRAPFWRLEPYCDKILMDHVEELREKGYIGKII